MNFIEFIKVILWHNCCYKINMMKKNKYIIGITLIEVMVSLFIISIILLITMELMLMFKRSDIKAEWNTIAAHWAENIMEKIYEASMDPGYPYQRIQYGATLPSGLQLPPNNIQRVDAPLPGGYYTIDIQDKTDTVANSAYKLITLRVNWRSSGREMRWFNFTLVTRLYPKTTV